MTLINQDLIPSTAVPTVKISDRAIVFLNFIMESHSKNVPNIEQSHFIFVDNKDETLTIYIASTSDPIYVISLDKSELSNSENFTLNSLLRN